MELILNILAVGLGTFLYLWDASTGDIDLLVDNNESNNVTSIKWSKDGIHLAVGTNKKKL